LDLDPYLITLNQLTDRPPFAMVHHMRRNGGAMSVEEATSPDQVRGLTFRTQGMPTQDGAGVKLTRIVGTPELDMIDPFLMLDWFGSDSPGDYIAGFPDHPHRGFETVTYMIDGRSRHKDSTGTEGVIGPGDVQWMTAGSGIIHSEMPEQDQGRLSGFQLWVNLPASQKMADPGYQEIKAADIPVERIDGGSITVIAGTTDAGTAGPAHAKWTEPFYFDVSLDAGAVFGQDVPDTHNVFFFVMDGAVQVTGEVVDTGELGVLGGSGRIEISGTESHNRFIIIAGKRLGEPIARYGPFVMNTKEEIMQAVEDYQQNKLIASPSA
jgi:redox-sensitive bicupin YhaK (pirin superfamily)